MDSHPWANSLCAVFADLIEYELTKETPDKDKIKEWLAWIKANCHTLATPAGSDPPKHLEPYLTQEGEGKGVTGTVVVNGKLMPKVAALRMKRPKIF
jgi:hypothetical protein